MNMNTKNKPVLKHTLCTALLGAALLATPVVPVAAEATYAITSGTQRAIHTGKAITRIAVGDPEIAGVSVVNTTSFLLTGKKVGSTSLLVWQRGSDKPREYRIEVGLPKLDMWPGLKLIPAGATPVLEGKVESLEDHAAAVAAVTKPAELRDNTETAFDNQVQINIKIVEVSRTKMMESGVFLGRNNKGNMQVISGPGVVSGVSGGLSGGSPGFTVNSSTGFLPSSNAFNLLLGNAGAGLLGVISLLESNGFAYTIASPTLAVLSGQSASFLAGGEIPIPVRGGTDGGSTTIEYREFGVRLNIAATVLGPNRVALKVAPEVSEPDFSRTVQTGGVAVPTFNVRKTETSVMLGNGESFVISGLLSRNVTNNIDKLPGLADLPVIGAFFRSKELRADDKELMMVVTTHLVRPMANGAEVPPLPGEHLRTYDPKFFDFMLDPSSPAHRLPTGLSQ